MKHVDTRLFEDYQNLPKFQKGIIQLYAIALEPIDNHTAVKCLTRLGIKPGTFRLDSKQLQIHLTLLQRDGFLQKKFTNDYCCVSSITDEVVKDVFKTTRFNIFADTIQSFLPIYTFGYWSEIPVERYYRSIRIALLKGDFHKIKELSRSALRQHEGTFDIDQAYSIINAPYDEEWLNKLPEDALYYGGLRVLHQLLNQFVLDEAFFDFLEKNKRDIGGEVGEGFRDLLSWRYIYQGDFAKAEMIAGIINKDTSRYHSFKGVIAFLEGENEVAISHFEESLRFYKKENSKRKVTVPYISYQFYYLALLKDNSTEHLQNINEYLLSLKKQLPFNVSLGMVIAAQENQMNIVRSLVDDFKGNGISLLLVNYAKYWIYRNQALISTSELEELYTNAADQNLLLPMQWISDLFEKTYQDEGNEDRVSHFKQISIDTRNKKGIISILDLMPKVEPWERSINALMSLSNQLERGQFASQKDRRVIWLINFKARSLEAKEQKIGKNGKWTKGRTVGHDKLTLSAQKEDFLTTKDLLVVQSIESRGWSNDNEFDFNDNLIKALIGHPHIYMNNEQRTAVEIIGEQPQLVVQKVGDNFELKFNLNVREAGMKLLKETPTRYKAIEVTDQHITIANAIGNDKIVLPDHTEEQLSKIIKGFSKVVNVQSELLTEDIDVRKVPSNSKIHVHLLPIGDGFQLEMYVKPFGLHPPYFKPSDGGTVILTEIEGERLQTERDLEEEKRAASEVLTNCPSLGTPDNFNKIWEFASPEECLEILSELNPLKGEEKIIIEWPKGERLKLRGTVSFDELTMSIKGSTDWFEASGTLTVGEDLVLSMKEVLDMMKKTESRFIQLKNGDFLALTQRFKTQLKALEAYSDPTEDGFRFHPLAAFAVEGLADEASEIETDAAWHAQLKRLKDAEKQEAQLPASFKAELREYQQEGYKWLMKLSNWGVGACLADDMGLGKTVQALAAILTRATTGPTLIVCPASVRINWEREAMKFTPMMNPMQFGDGNRQEILDNLKPYDMLITSYGLMQTEEEAFSKIQFSTIVLDEAQAIKNRSAKRSKAAMSLNSDFKVLTTGTPIENHLGELWNLFRFINPGLLGSLNRFKNRFAGPIEKYGDEMRREQLKKLIRPFILRRRKSEVLLELPEKTEIVLAVDLSPQEKAFYEALRQTALEKLKDVPPGGGGDSHLKILAEIMRLRQACCNPQLVTKNSTIKSSKLELFNSTIAELLENGHKVLVFSQFVQHLKILEKNLVKKDISYQYLDGSTSQKKRQIAIDAFQNGTGDVFLISLKAGGVGLNLTAADYVIHMDPWWNPAVEDQASDRAHRIGQKRPVTIYRLVTQGTIEEKIVKLHDQKRDLADSLLSGSNTSNRLTANDLMNLIKEGMAH